MTVKELKDKLETYADDVEVYITDKPREPILVHCINDEVEEQRRIVLW